MNTPLPQENPLPEADWDDLLLKEAATPNRAAVHCLCGRFAKFVRLQHYYNGTWDCARTIVDCSRCGEVWIEHV